MSGRGPVPTSENIFSFDTGHLQIELPRPDDAPILFGLVGGEHRREVTVTLLWDGPDHISDIEEWIEKCSNKTFADYGFHWAVRDKTGEFTGRAGEAMGAIGTRPRGEPGRADVGYWLGRPYWGKGIMGEALTELLELGFTTLDYYKMEADVYTSNARGLRLVESAGMVREGVVRQAYRKNGEWVDAAIYGILKEEWQANQSRPVDTPQPRTD